MLYMSIAINHYNFESGDNVFKLESPVLLVTLILSHSLRTELLSCIAEKQRCVLTNRKIRVRTMYMTW